MPNTISLRPDQANEELKNQLARTDNLIFKIIAAFIGNAALFLLFDFFLSNNSGVAEFIKQKPPIYSGIFDAISIILGLALLGFLICFVFLFMKHFKLLGKLNHKGPDPLSEKIMNLLKDWVKNDKNEPDV